MGSPTDYFVSPGSGSDTTGNGTIGTPWKSRQKALDTITRDATNGDCINIQAGTADVMTAPASMATYGTPTATAPLVHRGYTNVAGDGGIGVVDGAGTYKILNGGNHIHWVDLRLTNSGTTTLLTTGNECHLLRCTLDGYTGTGDVATIGNNNNIFHSEIYGANVTCGYECAFAYCYREGAGTLFIASSSGCAFIGNILRHTAGSSVDEWLLWFTYPGWAIGNTLDRGGGRGAGIVLGQAGNYGQSVVVNNIIANFNGAGGVAVLGNHNNAAVIGHNAFYNNTTNKSLIDTPILDLGADVLLSADPFVDRANKDYRLKTDAAALEAAWPQVYTGLAGVANGMDIGAYQRGAGAAGGLLIPAGMGGGING